MDKNDSAENIDPQKVFAKAIELITEIEHNDGASGLLLTYDSNAQKFQFLAMHADAEEVYALLLSGMGVFKETLKDTNADRTIN